MREKGLKVGLLLLAFALILFKHLNESKVYYIRANGEIGRLVESQRIDSKKDLTFHEYNLIVSGLSGKWLNLALNNTQITYKVFDVNRIAFWENLLLLTALILIIFNLKIKIGDRGLLLLLIIVGSGFFLWQTGFKPYNDDYNNSAYNSYVRTHIERVKNNLSDELNLISDRVNDHENRIDDVEYDVERLNRWSW